MVSEKTNKILDDLGYKPNITVTNFEELVEFRKQVEAQAKLEGLQLVEDFMLEYIEDTKGHLSSGMLIGTTRQAYKRFLKDDLPKLRKELQGGVGGE